MWIEHKYINLLSGQLLQFKQTGPDLWNFRCPYCHDSEKSKSKSRGYIYLKSGKYFYYCHNCTKGRTLQQFLREIDPELYRQYTIERFSEIEHDPIVVLKKPIAIINSNLAQLTKVSNLNTNHSCKKYVISRQIPTDYHYKLYYIKRFKQWVNSIVPDKFAESDSDNPRLVIPFLDRKEKMFGFQGRALYDSQAKYITIMLDENHPRIYGLDTVDCNRRYYCFEGPIDSMFINNGIATAGGKIDSELSKAAMPKEHCVVIYDNEPRNKQIIKNMLSAINKQYKVFIWPPSIEAKDVNEYVLSKINKPWVDTDKVREIGDHFKQIIDDNTFAGLSGQLAISQWRQTDV